LSGFGAFGKNKPSQQAFHPVNGSVFTQLAHTEENPERASDLRLLRCRSYGAFYDLVIIIC